MNIVTIIDSFKHSFSSQDSADLIPKILPNHHVQSFVVADGGEGTTEALTQLYGGELIDVEGVGPSGKPLASKIGWIPATKTAILESAEGAGIQKIDHSELNPFKLSTYGVGLHLLRALDLGAKRIIVGLGGSATIDCGFGLLCALGVVFKNQSSIMEPYDVRLGDIESMDISCIDSRIFDVEIVLASDVTNPLLGVNGAVTVFGAQKGLDPSLFEDTERAMAHCANLYKQIFGVDHRETPGAGAAGGLGFALATLTSCTFISGIDLILQDTSIQKAINDADLVISGEGSIDSQSMDGKLISGVLRECTSRAIPVVLVCGRYELNEQLPGVKDVLVISNPDAPLVESLRLGLRNLRETLVTYFKNN